MPSETKTLSGLVHGINPYNREVTLDSGIVVVMPEGVDIEGLLHCTISVTVIIDAKVRKIRTASAIAKLADNPSLQSDDGKNVFVPGDDGRRRLP